MIPCCLTVLSDGGKSVSHSFRQFSLREPFSSRFSSWTLRITSPPPSSSSPSSWRHFISYPSLESGAEINLKVGAGRLLLLHRCVIASSQERVSFSLIDHTRRWPSSPCLSHVQNSSAAANALWKRYWEETHL